MLKNKYFVLNINVFFKLYILFLLLGYMLDTHFKGSLNTVCMMVIGGQCF